MHGVRGMADLSAHVDWLLERCVVACFAAGNAWLFEEVFDDSLGYVLGAELAEVCTIVGLPNNVVGGLLNELLQGGLLWFLWVSILIVSCWCGLRLLLFTLGGSVPVWPWVFLNCVLED